MNSREEALRKIKDALAGREYLVLDTETTGLVLPELVSVAVIDNRGRTIINEIVRPAKAIDPEASAVTGISNESVAGRPEFPAIHEKLRTTLDGRIVVIYNAAYDLQVIANTCARYGLEIPRFRPWCAMEWFARLYGNWDERRHAYAWQKLSVAASYFEVKQEAAHTALGDCITTWRVMEKAIQESEKTQPYMEPLL